MTGATGTGRLCSDDNTRCMATSRTAQQL